MIYGDVTIVGDNIFYINVENYTVLIKAANRDFIEAFGIERIRYRGKDEFLVIKAAKAKINKRWLAIPFKAIVVDRIHTKYKVRLEIELWDRYGNAIKCMTIDYNSAGAKLFIHEKYAKIYLMINNQIS